MRMTVVLAVVVASALLLPLCSAQAGELPLVVVQGLENLSHAKAGYTAPTVSAWPTASSITYGQTLADATLTGGTASVPGRFAFAAPTTKPAAGNFVADAQFIPSDTTAYSIVNGTIGITVDPAEPTVTAWPAASAISLGDTLAASSFSGGAASVPGTFTFTAPDTAPGSTGTYTASVTFTPTDSGNYSTVQGTVSLTVNAAAVDYPWYDYVGIPVLMLAAVGIVRLAESNRLGGPCFIASAAWGTPLAPEVDRLRIFRDNTLLAGVLGTAVVDVYYHVSPAIADVVAASPALAMLVRMALLPILVLISLPAVLVGGLGLLAAAMLLRRSLRNRREDSTSAE